MTATPGSSPKGTPMTGGAGPGPLPCNGPTPEQAAALDDFCAYMPGHTYIFTPTREMWPASSVNARIAPIAVAGRDKPLPANAWLDWNRSVEQMTWCPGEPMEIRDRLVADGGWINRPGCTIFNLYRPPTILPTQGDASPWVNHARYVFGDDAEHGRRTKRSRRCVRRPRKSPS
jgi:hypothetical protein